MTFKSAPAQIAVDPARLNHGTWCHRTQKTLGKGDIALSYSADRIGMGQPLRKPFAWRGSLWVCVGTDHRRGLESAEGYRLVPPGVFAGKPTTYGERVIDRDASRADPLGFYNSMEVKCGGATMVLAGPPVIFTAGQSEQLDLFG